MKLDSFLKLADNSITEGGVYAWDCYGKNARYLDCEKDFDTAASAVYDVKTKEVFEVTLDLDADRYRWVKEVYFAPLRREYKARGLKLNFEGYIEVSESKMEDLIKKAFGTESSVEVPLDLSDEEVFELMKMAHEKDMSLNQFVDSLLREMLEK